VQKHLTAHDDIAAVILEPVTGNMGVVQPTDAFIKGLRDLTKSKGVLLICDEVMTGFRSHFGGAQELLGIQADITCLGKVIGGGFPVGAYGASDEIMENVAPLGGMYQAGTLSGNPIAMASGMATLLELKRKNPYLFFEEIGKKIEIILLEAAGKYGVALTVNRFGSMLNPFFAKGEVSNFKDAQACDAEKFSIFFWAMIRNGVFLPPSQYEAWFLSTALRESDLFVISKAVDKAMAAVSEAS
jgi:glutamate-1-semialdehyde 2,1-aminomutase